MQNGRPSVFLVGAFIIVLAAVAGPVRADIYGLQGFVGAHSVSVSDVTVGWSFDLSAPIIVTRLGVWDMGSDGLAEGHRVTIWDSVGTPVVSREVTSAGAAPWHMAPVADTYLVPGSYVIGAYYATDADNFLRFAASVNLAPELGAFESAYVSGNAFPTEHLEDQDEAYFGPNFLFKRPDAVPEPALVQLPALLGFGCVCALARRKRIGKSAT